MSTKLLYYSPHYRPLADQLAGHDLKLAEFNLGRYADGEIMFELKSPVDQADCIVLASSFPPAENLLEIFTMINTLKLNHARSITLVIPYMGYSKSDHLERPGCPDNSRLFAQYLSTAGVNRIIALNLHSQSVIDSIEVPLVHLSALPLFAEYLKSKILDLKSNYAVASPDLGGRARAEEMAELLNSTNLIIVEKYRPMADQAKVIKVTGSPEGKDIILVDDLIQTGNTLIKAAEALKRQGAKDIYVCVTHFVYSAGALSRLTSSLLFKQIIVTDSIPFPSDLKKPAKLKVLPITDLISKAI